MRNLRSTVFSLHRQELMAATTLLPVYKQWGYGTTNEAIFSIPFTKNVFAFIPEPCTTRGYAFHQSGGIQGIKDITLSKVSLYQFASNQMYLVIGA